MTDNGNRGDGSTQVTIFGRIYRLRGDGEDDYLMELAELVDGKMREVEAATGTADSLKIAILASLNIADDYLKASGGNGPAGAHGDLAGRGSRQLGAPEMQRRRRSGQSDGALDRRRGENRNPRGSRRSLRGP